MGKDWGNCRLEYAPLGFHFTVRGSLQTQLTADRNVEVSGGVDVANSDRAKL